MDEINIEKSKLNEIITKYDEVLFDSELELKNVYKLYENPDDAELKKAMLENKIKILNQNILKPYFARIDFETDINKDICYIGKVGISDYDNNIITVDWRAPISSLYYDSNIGQTFYKVDKKIIAGNLLLKRQYNIENRFLISFTDVDTVANDELLKPYLGISADARLKNIVSTIQSEQNEIIRSDMSHNLIVQGVAGSGKTTVALHRIAYLVYTYRNLYNNNQYMVIGPNKFFINYISSVLPDLDVTDVKQYDLVEFSFNYLNEKINIDNGYTNISKIKTSMIFKDIIDEYIDMFNEKYINSEDIMLKNIVVIPNKVIKDTWNDLKNKKYESLNLRIDRCKLLLEKYFDEHKVLLKNRVNEYIDSLINNYSLETIRKERIFLINELNKGCHQLLNKYFNKLSKKTTIVYKEILININNDNFLFDNKFYYEDITPLMYLNYKLIGSTVYNNIKHVVIDEAQDYNELTFYALKKIMCNSTFSIYGDLAQSLYPYRSIDNWDSTKYIVFNNDIDIRYLSKSYRTSIEIMSEANKINKLLKLPEAEAVIRHGDPVEYLLIKDYLEDIKSNLNRLINKGLKSIALITKDEVESQKIFDYLKIDYNINYINEDNQMYTGNICIITSKLSKGLEFDGVIITDASNDIYNKDDVLDMKLLYVSMTRAMHNLIVLYRNKLFLINNK